MCIEIIGVQLQLTMAVLRGVVITYNMEVVV